MAKKEIFWFFAMVMILNAAAIESSDIFDQEIKIPQENGEKEYSLSLQRDLSSGKNLVMFNIETSLTARKMIETFPEIDSISYKNKDNQTVGFVRALSGIGKDFKISQNTIYEINVRNPVKILFKANPEG